MNERTYLALIELSEQLKAKERRQEQLVKAATDFIKKTFDLDVCFSYTSQGVQVETVSTEETKAWENERRHLELYDKLVDLGFEDVAQLADDLDDYPGI